jgi:hypothetical protein
MKAERRHELRENDLAHYLTVARDYIEENGGRIGLILFAVIGVIAVATLTVRSRAADLEDAWRRRSQLTFQGLEDGRESIRTLESLAQASSDRHFVMSCLIDIGKQSLRLAREVPWPPDQELNDKAGDAFQKLLQRFGNNPIARGVALNGLATVEENRFLLAFDGDEHKEKARDFLTQIINDTTLNGTPLQSLAINRRNRIEDTFVRIRFDNPPPEPPADALDVDEAVDEADVLGAVDFADDPNQP